MAEVKTPKNAFTDQSTLTGKVANLGEQLIDSALGGLSPLNNFGRYFTGSRAVIKINGKLFGFAFAVNYNVQTAADEINTIDDYTPWELAPSRITVSGNMSMFHIPGKGPNKEMVQANVLSFLFHKYITIEISDRTTGQTIFKTDKAMIVSKSQSIMAGELSTIELQWKAIGWSDEFKPFYPSKHNGVESTQGGGLGAIVDDIKKLF